MRKIKGVKNHCIAGFTLIELMITLVISSLIIASIYAAYTTQQRTYTTQERVVEMQQNLCAGMLLMTGDIRMAGYDAQQTGKYKFTTATGTKLVFSADLNGDGGNPGAGETMTYELYTPAGASLTALRRIAGQPAVAENIQAVEFQYLDGNGNVLPLPLISQANRDKIRSVQISILARAGMPDRKFTNTMTYTTASGATWGPYINDNYRRRLLIQTVNCRNMGL